MAAEAAILLRERHTGKEWVDKLYDISDITATACLCHDLGNPPFGHSGEKTIATYFSEGKGMGLEERLTPEQWADLIHFEGNANSFRLLTHQFVGRRSGGYAMTYSSLASIVKYPHSSIHSGKKGKFGFFESEKGIYYKVAEELGIPELSRGRFARHPLVWLMEAADDICYQIMDLEDAHRLKLLSTKDVSELLFGFFDESVRDKRKASMMRLADPNEQIGYLRSRVIGELVEACARVFVDNEESILAGTHEKTLIKSAPDILREAYDECARVAESRIYCTSDVVDIEIAGNRILTYLLEVLMDAAMHPERNFSRLLLQKMPRQYDVHAADTYGKVMAVLDHVSGMTDIYALDLFRQLNGHSLPQV